MTPLSRAKELAREIIGPDGDVYLLGSGLPKARKVYELCDFVLALPEPAQVREEWQPIETAPKDGTEVLVVLAHTVERMAVANWSEFWQTWTVANEATNDPTHWWPAPPSSEPRS